MKKIIISMCAAVVLMIMATGCAGTYNTAAVVGIQNPVANTHVAARVDYANATPVQGYGEEKAVLGIFKWGKNRTNSFKASNRYKGLNGSEKRAMYDAVENSHADIILEPQFKNKTKSYFFGVYRYTKTYMTGWAAKIIGFEEDSNVQSQQTVNMNASEPSTGIPGIF